MQHINNFILVDDDIWTNKVTEINITRAIRTAKSIAFTLPEEALNYLRTRFTEKIEPTILFLDINMPKMNGWEFLEQYELLSEELRNNITVYMLSSSIDMRDIEKAKANPNVKNFISKPLLPETIVKLPAL